MAAPGIKEQLRAAGRGRTFRDADGFVIRLGENLVASVVVKWSTVTAIAIPDRFRTLVVLRVRGGEPVTVGCDDVDAAERLRSELAVEWLAAPGEVEDEP